MNKFITLFCGVFLAEAGFAFDHIICQGGLKRERYAMTVELNPEGGLSNDLLVGTLATEEGAIDFSVQKRIHDYYFRAQKQSPQYLYISEKVPVLPAIRSKMIAGNTEVFIECKE